MRLMKRGLRLVRRFRATDSEGPDPASSAPGRRARLWTLVGLGMSAVVIAAAAAGCWAYREAEWDALSARRAIWVDHAASEGTQKLPEALTAEMVIVTAGSAKRDTDCTVKVRGVSRNMSESSRGWTSLDVRAVLTDSFFRDRPREPLTFRTTGCEPWQIFVKE